jgi:GNAT superfamily N-acetyltransferase
MQVPIRELARADRPALRQHFLSLESHDRRLRFGAAFSDHAVRAYVERCDFERDAVFGVFGEKLELVGVAHLARSDAHAELGISVLEGHRGRGIGGALLERAHIRGRNWGLKALFMHCLSENAVMMRLARRQGVEIMAQAGEADAWLTLPRADAASHFGEVFAQRVALFDYTLKAQVAAARRIAEALTSGAASPDPGK